MFPWRTLLIYEVVTSYSKCFRETTFRITRNGIASRRWGLREHRWTAMRFEFCVVVWLFQSKIYYSLPSNSTFFFFLIPPQEYDICMFRPFIISNAINCKTLDLFFFLNERIKLNVVSHYNVWSDQKVCHYIIIAWTKFSNFIIWKNVTEIFSTNPKWKCKDSAIHVTRVIYAHYSFFSLALRPEETSTCGAKSDPSKWAYQSWAHKKFKVCPTEDNLVGPTMDSSARRTPPNLRA